MEKDFTKKILLIEDNFYNSKIFRRTNSQKKTWIDARKDYVQVNNKIISKESMKEFFKTIIYEV